MLMHVYPDCQNTCETGGISNLTWMVKVKLFWKRISFKDTRLLLSVDFNRHSSFRYTLAQHNIKTVLQNRSVEFAILSAAK